MHCKTRFDFERSYWNQRYANHDPRGSGGGSYGDEMLRKVKLLSELPYVDSITEIGSGDFHFGKHLVEALPYAKYDGYDVSDVVIERNQKYFKALSPRVEFHHAFGEIIRPADLVLCVDVLFHVIDDDNYDALLKDLGKLWKKYLAVTAYEYDGPSDAHVRIRKFDPSYFGEPIVREVVEQDGLKMFYVFEK